MTTIPLMAIINRQNNVILLIVFVCLLKLDSLVSNTLFISNLPTNYFRRSFITPPRQQTSYRAGLCYSTLNCIYIDADRENGTSEPAAWICQRVVKLPA